MILDDGCAWNGCVYRSLSQVAKAITGTNWNGHRFFGLKAVRTGASNRRRNVALQEKTGFPFERERVCVCVAVRESCGVACEPLAPTIAPVRGSRQ